MPEHFREIAKSAGLRKDVDRAKLARPVSRFGFGVSRQNHDRQIRKSASNSGKNGQSVEPRHHEVKEYAIDRRGFDHVERFDSVEGHENVMPFDSQNFCEHLGYGRIVFDYQYAHRRVRVGSIRAEGSARQDLTFRTCHAI